LAVGIVPVGIVVAASSHVIEGVQAMQTNWLIVADEAVAHIFQWQGASRRLEEVETLTHPAAHSQEAELRRDAQGRNSQAARPMSSVTSSASLDMVHGEAIQFARRVAERLGRAQTEDRFQQLIIAAAPRFLGLLRQELAPQVTALVKEDVDKDLVHEKREDLERRFLGEPKR
jgi:protein required for attachment to host cells